jgi:hypothetical protein
LQGQLYARFDVNARLPAFKMAQGTVKWFIGLFPLRVFNVAVLLSFLVMENRKETIEIPKKFTECAQHLRVSIKNTVWACCEPMEVAIKWGIAETWDQSVPLESKQV